MKNQTIGIIICAATFLMLSGTHTASWAKSTAQKTANANKKSTGKKHDHNHDHADTCEKCGKAEKDCTCENKKHKDHGDEHKGHSHDEAEEKNK